MKYADYLSLCGGGNPVPESEFEFFAKKAEALLEGYTFGRSRNKETPELCCAEAELIGWLFESRGRRGIASESNDGLSVSYEGGTDTGYAIAKQWLGNSGILYSGVERNDYRQSKELF